MREECVTLSRDELRRVKVMERLLAGVMSGKDAAATIGITERQLRRLKTKYLKEGETGLIHGNRGRKPSNALPEELKAKVLILRCEKYHDANFCHLADLLAEHEDIYLSRESVRRILKSAGHESKRAAKRSPRRHRARERRAQAGMLWQTDATPYEWLGGQYGRFALHAAIDDAAGIVVGGCFTRNECAGGYGRALSEGMRAYGIPMALYSGRHTIFRSPREGLTIDEELGGEEKPLSNFGKAMAELGVEHIKAGSPQAKGRVERLWETLQDRLPVELRLLGVKDMDGANHALPELLSRHNRKYSVPPAEAESAYTPLPDGINLEHVFAMRNVRKTSGGAISYKGCRYVTASGNDSVFSDKTAVEVRETESGEVLIWNKGRAVPLRKLDGRKAPERAAREDQKSGSGKKGQRRPSAGSPWRQS
jgi:transposase